MGRKAKPEEAKVPSNVTVEFITPTEKQQRIEQAPPGGGAVNPAQQPPGTITTSYLTPSADEQQAQDATDQLIGRGAIIAARKFGVDYVWSTQTKKKITLESAETLCRKNPGLIYFDFDALDDIAAALEQQSKALEMEIPSEAEDSEPLGADYAGVEYVDPNDETAVPFEASADQEVDEIGGLPTEADYMAEQPSKEQLIAEARREAREADLTDGLVGGLTAEERRVSEVERRAWGGTLSAPGIQVYMHPNGIARVDVEGPVRIQKGLAGSVRTLRIQRLETTPGGKVRNVTRKTVTGATSRSPNPNAQFRRIEAPRIPIPVPPETDLDDGDDY